MTHLTKSERFLLNEVDSCPDKVARVIGLRQSARHLSYAGFHRVLAKMLDQNLLGHADGATVTLTFGGMMAMRANGMEVQ